jgi:hypothetical protein
MKEEKNEAERVRYVALPSNKALNGHAEALLQ